MANRRYVHGTVSKAYPLTVQTDALTVDQWLCRVVASRPRLPLEERQAALLWSWPVRPALTRQAPHPFFPASRAEKETRALQDEARRHLAFLASAWYPFESPTASAS